MTILFFGSSKYSTIVASALNKTFGLTLVVTIPDRTIGRKKILTPSPVKQFAIDNNVPVLTFDKLDKEAVEKIKASLKNVIPSAVEESLTSKSVEKDPSMHPSDAVWMTKAVPDFLVVADYGLILSDTLLQLPKYVPLNVHHSLLPKYRGPSPAPTTILHGDKISGVSIIHMTDEVDAGPILAQQKYTLKADETTDSLLTILNTLGGELVVDVIKNFGSTKPVAQDESKATFTKHMTKQDGFIDLENPPSPAKLDRMIRAYYPWPKVWTKCEVRSQKFEVLNFLPKQKIQVGGGKAMSIKDFLNGYPEMKEPISKLGYS